MTDFNRLLQKLVDADIDFVIVGGFAAVLHGSAKVTRDLDVCAVLTSANVEKLRSALLDANPMHRISSPRQPFRSVPAPGESARNLYLQTDVGALDVLSEISGVGEFDRVASTAIEVEVFGHRVRVLSLDDLIAAKEHLGRNRDKLDLAELYAIRAKQRS